MVWLVGEKFDMLSRFYIISFLHNYEGRSITKLQNDTILLIFKI